MRPGGSFQAGPAKSTGGNAGRDAASGGDNAFAAAFKRAQEGKR
jgi:hypothetical protein